MHGFLQNRSDQRRTFCRCAECAVRQQSPTCGKFESNRLHAPFTQTAVWPCGPGQAQAAFTDPIRADFRQIKVFT